MRDLEIIVTDLNLKEGQEIPPAWKDITSGHSGNLQRLTSCEFGPAEEVIGLLEFDDGLYEVGIGESLRPYDMVINTNDFSEALRIFWMIVAGKAGNLTFAEEHVFDDESS